ncbi:ABC transporter permease [Marispirochaeta sp.]|jgi:ABC-type nitrate/sulfonate/bicarbonate transport system permease component|uniref:ABC transporter permease n=1 Tax=Marispirochaeta sp. TaxID=2038653 RepID=UPI0029C8420A|nr:ABC transporter permease [Marispirochaeta sp.]
MKKTVCAVLFLAALWWAFSAILSRPFLPSPLTVTLEMLRELGGGSLMIHLGSSLFRVLTALAAAFVPALVLGVLSGTVKAADSMVSPVVYVLFPVPKIALLPIILLFLGLGDLSKIFLVALIVFFQFYLEIRDGTAAVNRHYFDSLYTLGGSRRDLLVHVILPALLPRIFSSLRLTLGTAFAVLFLAETFATRLGIGWYIMDSWSRVAYAQMYAGIMALSLAGLLFFAVLDLLQRLFCRWTL